MSPWEPSSAPRFSFGSTWVDLGTGAVTRAGADEPRLRPLELALVVRLYAESAGTVPRERLLAEVWGYAAASPSRAIDATWSRLRARLEPDPAHPRYLLTDHGRGYALARPPPGPERPLVGRLGLLDRIDAWIGANPGGWLTLVGAGGIGKSRVLAGLAGRAGRGVVAVYVDVEAEGVGALAAALDGAAGPRLVFADLGPLAPATLEGLPVHRGPSTVVAAARTMLDRRGEAVLPVPPLDPDERALLLDGAGWTAEQVRAVVDASEGLPLALHLARGRADGPGDAAGAWLAALTDPLAAPRHRSLDANRRSTLDLVSPAARRAWEGLPRPIGDDALLDELVAARLITWTGDRPRRAPWAALPACYTAEDADRAVHRRAERTPPRR